MSRTSVVVDCIVLRGVDPHDAQALIASLRSELALALADPSARAALSRSHASGNLRLGPMPLVPGRAGARTFGVRMARAISKGVRR